MSRALVASQRLPQAESALASLLRSRKAFLAPQILQAEFVSAVRRLEKRGRVSESEVSEALEEFWSIPIRYSWNEAWVLRALQVARGVGLSTVYDAVYLACAEEYDAELLTCDANFCAAFGADLPKRVKLVHGR